MEKKLGYRVILELEDVELSVEIIAERLLECLGSEAGIGALQTGARRPVW